MKITIFIGGLSGGGAERVTCNLANYLARKKHDVEIITIGNVEPAEILDKRIKHVPLLTDYKEYGKTVGKFLRIKRLHQYLKQNNRDCYVVMLTITSALLLSMKRSTNAAIVCSERVDPESHDKFQKTLLKIMAHRADGYVMQTTSAEKWIIPYLKGKESVVIPNAINPSFIGPRFNGKRAKTIVAAGRLTEQKNFSLLLRSFAIATKQVPGYTLKIFGKGPLLSKLQIEVHNLGIDGQVEFPGFSNDLKNDIKIASIFVLSSDFEGMPNVLMEALALGTPCISTNCSGGGAEFLISNKENGLLVPINDEESMSKAIVRLMQDEKFAETLGTNAIKIQERLSPDIIYEEWEKFVIKKAKEKNPLL